jgi:hypothetical protein
LVKNRDGPKYGPSGPFTAIDRCYRLVATPVGTL